MLTIVANLSRTSVALFVCASLVSWGAVRVTASAPPTTQVRAASIPGLLRPSNERWSPEALEDLLAPVALYPDEFIGHVLVASTNPQEVMDAGNWRVNNASLSGTALDGAAKHAGFTPPVRMLLQNPIVLDMMCSELGWTEEIGQAYVDDQAGVLDAVQRLRAQARDAGNLRSSDQMVVETVNEGGHEAILLSSPDPNVVNVPQYDPEAVYTKLDDDDHDGVSMTTTIVTAALAFGGGLLVGKLFDDDDDDDWDDDDYYHPNYYGPPPPYYAHRPYYPAYPGYAPAVAYAPPPGYAYGYGRGNNVVVHKTVNNYWNRYDDTSYTRRGNRTVVSPITKARRNRPELAALNAQARRGPVRRAPEVTAERNLYDTRKKETAARAERRRAMTTGDRVGDPTVGGPARPTLEPTTKGRNRAAGTPRVAPRVDTNGTPTAGGPVSPTLEPTTKRRNRAAGAPRVEPRVETNGTPTAGTTKTRTHNRAGNRAGVKSAEPTRTRTRTDTAADGVNRTPTDTMNRTPRKGGGNGGARRAEPPATTAAPPTPKARRNAETPRPQANGGDGSDETTTKGGGRGGGAKKNRPKATNAPPQ